MAINDDPLLLRGTQIYNKDQIAIIDDHIQRRYLDNEKYKGSKKNFKLKK